MAQGNAVLIAQIEKKKQKEIEAEQRKAFKIKKASDIAGAIIDGARAVTSTFFFHFVIPLIKYRDWETDRKSVV